MNPLGRTVWLGGALMLVALGGYCLRQAREPQSAPPTLVPDAVPLEGVAGNSRTAPQPMILSAEPSPLLVPPAEYRLRDPQSSPAAESSPPIVDPPVPASFTAPESSTPLEVPDSAETKLPPIDSNQAEPTSTRLGTVRPAFATAPSRPTPSAVVAAAASEPATSSELEPRDPPVPTRPASVIAVDNDSLWKISERVYGHGRHFQALFAANRERLPNPDRIAAGTVILTPPIR